MSSNEAPAPSAAAAVVEDDEAQPPQFKWPPLESNPEVL